MDEAGVMHRGQRPTEVDPSEDRFALSKRAAFRKVVRQCSPMDEFHPESDLPLVHVGSVHDDDIRMANPRQAACLIEEAPRTDAFDRGFDLAQLEGHLAQEARVDCPIDLAEGAATDLLENRQVAPAERASQSAVLTAFPDRRIERDSGGERNRAGKGTDGRSRSPGAGEGG